MYEINVRTIKIFSFRCRMCYPSEAMTESEEKKTKETDLLVSDESQLSSGNNQGTHQLNFW